MRALTSRLVDILSASQTPKNYLVAISPDTRWRFLGETTFGGEKKKSVVVECASLTSGEPADGARALGLCLSALAVDLLHDGN